MSLEDKISELNDSIGKLISILSNQTNPIITVGTGKSGKGTIGEMVDTIITDSSNVPKTDDCSSEQESDVRIAKKKTYVVFENEKRGLIVQAGEEVPEGDGIVTVNRTNYAKMARDLGFDPRTGESLSTPEPESEDDDLDDLDDVESPEPEPEPESEDDDLDDLLDGLGDDEPQPTIDDVKVILRKVISCDDGKREKALKILNKFGVRNVQELDESKYAEIIKFANSVIQKLEK